jgi:hypothetical protein
MITPKEKFIRELIQRNKTKFFGVQFLKVDGKTKRSFSCRTRVSKHVVGVGLKYDPEKRNNLVVWVPNAKESDPHNKYRTIKIPNITCLKINKKVYTWSL